MNNSPISTNYSMARSFGIMPFKIVENADMKSNWIDFWIVRNMSREDTESSDESL